MMQVNTINGREGYIPNLCSKAMVGTFDDLSYQHACKRVAGLFHIFIGSAYNIAQSVMVDAAAELRKHKDLYRFQVKYDVVEALKGYDQVHAMHRTDLGVMYETWLDAIDIMDEEVKTHIDKMYWSIDNILLKKNVKEHRLMARMEVAYAVISVARKCFQSLCRVAEENVYHHHNTRLSSTPWISFKDVLFHWERACDTLIKKMGIHDINLHDDEICNRALKVVINRIIDFDRINEQTERAIELHPEIDPRIDEGIEELKRKYNSKAS